MVQRRREITAPTPVERDGKELDEEHAAVEARHVMREDEEAARGAGEGMATQPEGDATGSDGASDTIRTAMGGWRL